jgi:hypothetical protein
MPLPPFRDPALLGDREEIREPPSIKPPSPSPSEKRHHVGFHLFPLSTLGFATTSSTPAPRTSTSSPTPPSTSEHCYRRHQPLVGPRRHGEPFLVSFRFPRPSTRTARVLISQDVDSV